MTEPTVIVTIRDIFNAHHWDDFCDKYGMNPYAVNEGLVSMGDTVSISLTDCISWKISFLTRAHE